MIDAQSYCTKYKKGKGFFATWNLRKLFGLRNPQYDNLVYVTPDLKSYINAIAKIMMYTIGKHRSLWFIIKLLDKNKKKLEYGKENSRNLVIIEVYKLW